MASKKKTIEYIPQRDEELKRQMRRESKDHDSWKIRLRKEREAYNTYAL
jgi:hypothetical protein